MRNIRRYLELFRGGTESYIIAHPITPFKIIQGLRCRYQSKNRMQFLTYPISYRLEVIADNCSNFAGKPATLRFEPPLGGL